MAKNIHNPDLEQGRYGRTIITGSSRKEPPGGYVFGGLKVTTAGAVNQSTGAPDMIDKDPNLWVGDYSALTTLVAGDWYPGRMSSIIGDGTLQGILYHEPL